MKNIFITRTKREGYDDCKKWLNQLANNNKIDVFIIISDLRKLEGQKIGRKRLFDIFDTNPTSAISLNKAIQEIKKIYSGNRSERKHFLIVSKEVELTAENIDTLIEKISPDNTTLVVGFDLQDNVLTNEEYEIFCNGNGIAYQVPWNTCAIWNYDLFIKYVGEFDNICYNNQFDKLKVKIKDKIEETEYEGMEDGLAILKAVNENDNLKFFRLEDKLPWNISNNSIKRHKQKMARKNIVLSMFANIKGYSIDKLKIAKK